MALADTLTRAIAAKKRALLKGGLLQEVEWGVVVPQDPPDPRGRKVYAYSEIDAFIEQRPALDRGSGFTTDRNDDTTLTILDPVAITDEHLFRFGDPLHVYSVKAVDGVVANEETGVRFSSEVIVVR